MIQNNFSKNFKTKVVNIIQRDVFMTFLSVVGVSLILLGNSYAMFTSFNSSKNYNTLNVGTLKIDFSNVNLDDALNLNNSLPISDEDGLKTSGYKFFLTNTGTLASKYVVKLVDDTEYIKLDNCIDKLMPKNFIKVSMNNSIPVLLGDLKNNDYIITEGVLQPGEKILYSLKAWLDIQSDNTIFNKHYHGKLLIEGVKDELTEAIGKIENILVDAKKIGTNASIISTDNEQLFIAGENPNNYIWYSGKLWRAISVDNNGNSKLVTDEVITVIPYGKNNQEFLNTYAYSWLNNIFYNTLRNPDNYLVNNSYYVEKTDTYAKPSGDTKVFKVGLIHPYEYTMVNKEGNYLNIEANYALLPYNTTSNIWIVNSSGELRNQNSNLYIGLRPVITMKKGINIVYGDGTRNNPYRLENDNDRYLSNVSLNTRYSGEYVNYNGNLFRIVSIKDKITKLISVNNLGVSKFDDYLYIYQDNTKIHDYLNRLWSASLDSKYLSMIKTNYYGNGTVRIGEDYMNANKNGINTLIGLPMVGDLFTSWISENKSLGTSFYVANNVTEGKVSAIDTTNSLLETSNQTTSGVKATINLKENIIISSGTGMIDNPFKIIYDN